MARLFSSGFELNDVSVSSATAFEWIAANTVSLPTMSTSVLRSGSYAARFSSFTTSVRQVLSYQFALATLNVAYVRAYVRFDTLPGVTTNIFGLGGTAALSSFGAGFRITSTGTLEGITTFGGTIVVGASAAISTGVWYRLEVKADVTNAAGSQAADFRVDGTSIGSTTSASFNATSNLFVNVGRDAVAGTTGDWFFDDVAVNDTTGSAQTSWPGDGKIVHLKPNAIGDNNQWEDSATAVQGTSVYTAIDEVSPNDVTDYVKRTTTTPTAIPIDDWGMENSTVPSIASYDTVTLIQVGFRGGAISTSSGTQRQLDLRLKSASGATVATATGIPIHVNGWTTNSQATPKNYQLTSYTDPTTGSAWTPTGTNSIDNMQVGYKGNVSSATEIRVSTLWALVEYVPGSPPAAGSGSFFFTE